MPEQELVDWVLKTVEDGTMIVRLDLTAHHRYGEIPDEVFGMIICHSRRLNDRFQEAAGYLHFRSWDARFDHFHVEAWQSREKWREGIAEVCDHWTGVWAQHQPNVCEISKTHLLGGPPGLPFNNQYVTHHLALVLGMLMRSDRPSYSKAQNAVLREMSFRMHSVLNRSLAEAFAGFMYIQSGLVI